jgi:general nucleoside transport system permease protein
MRNDRLRRLVGDLTLLMASVLGAVLLVVAGLYVAGYPGMRVLGEWAAGAVGTRFDVEVGLKNACPLILTGLAAGVAFRSGVLNIGAEGQAILGAIGAVALANRLIPPTVAAWPVLAIVLTLAGAMMLGALWGGIAGALDRWRGVPVVLSTILLSFVAMFVLGMLLEGPLRAQGSEVVQSDPLARAYWLPVWTWGVEWRAGFVIALAMAGVSWLVQARTALGFELLVTGLNPTAAKLAGIPVAARQVGVMLLSGAFAGLAGAIQVMGVEGHTLTPSPTSYGYAGIAVALLGRLHPAGIVAAAVFFGMLDQGAANVETGAYALPHQVADVVKGLIVMAILVGTAYVARMRTTARER